MQRSMPTAGPEETVVWFTPDVRVLFMWSSSFVCLRVPGSVCCAARPSWSR